MGGRADAMVVRIYVLHNMAEPMADTNGQVYEDMMLPAERVDTFAFICYDVT